MATLPSATRQLPLVPSPASLKIDTATKRPNGTSPLTCHPCAAASRPASVVGTTTSLLQLSLGATLRGARGSSDMATMRRPSTWLATEIDAGGADAVGASV